MSVHLEGPGDRLRALRELLALTQVELADRAGITQGHLSKLERGIVAADPALLAHIAGSVNVPSSFFAVGAFGIAEGSLRFRKQARALSRETKQVRRFIIEAYRACSELTTAVRLPPPGLPLAEASADLDGDSIEKMAALTRQALSIPDSVVVGHVTRSLERAGILVVPITLPGPTADEGASAHYGASTWRGPWEAPLVGFFRTHAGDRHRFTLAHELGHLVLHQLRNPPPATAENEANRFAGAFLVPAENMHAALATTPVTLSRLQAMKAGWGMAIQALIMRAHHLDLVDQGRKQSLFAQLTARGWRRAEPVKVPVEQPLLVEKLFAARFGSPIDWRRAASELGLPQEILSPLVAPNAAGE